MCSIFKSYYECGCLYKRIVICEDKKLSTGKCIEHSCTETAKHYYCNNCFDKPGINSKYNIKRFFEKKIKTKKHLN